MICGSCAAAGRHNKEGDGFDADVFHSMCVNFELYSGNTKTWCDCGHVVTVEFEEPAGCPNCDGVRCMDCRCRMLHDECVDDCPSCCQPLADWEREEC